MHDPETGDTVPALAALDVFLAEHQLIIVMIFLITFYNTTNDIDTYMFPVRRLGV